MTDSRFLLYAPNVHTGGGAVLLEALLRALPLEQPVVAWLDERAHTRWPLPTGMEVHWVKASIGSRWRAERQLLATAREQDRLLCFHGLPPLWRSLAHTAVFLQNRLLLGAMPLQRFSWKTRLRLSVEQKISIYRRGHVDAYWVQTESMADALRSWWGGGAMPPLHVLGFAPPLTQVQAAERRYDFIYVADGEAHKNHRRLLAAWSLLAEQGLRPSLALTLGERDAVLRAEVEAAVLAHQLRVEFLPPMNHPGVLAAYARAGALVFPSLGESYGLPLIEAQSAGLPIVAAERDYVREVCVPVQSFDPESPRSIARAIERYLGLAQPPASPATAAVFLRALLS